MPIIDDDKTREKVEFALLEKLEFLNTSITT